MACPECHRKKVVRSFTSSGQRFECLDCGWSKQSSEEGGYMMRQEDVDRVVTAINRATHDRMERYLETVL